MHWMFFYSVGAALDSQTFYFMWQFCEEHTNNKQYDYGQQVFHSHLVQS